MIERYNRQVRYHQFGEHGQRQLQKTHVMIMGAGALGSHSAEMLVRMGVGSLTVIDMDIVELSNLHRQALYDELDAEQMLPKVEALKHKLNQINSNVQVTTIDCEITNLNIENLLTTYRPDIVIDGMDHFKIRYLINESCNKHNIPWIYGAAVGSQGTVYGIDDQGPCLKCLLETMPSTGESCAINGVLPPVIYQVASMQVSELMRWATNEAFSKKLITMDCFNMQYKSMDISALKQSDCNVCEKHDYALLNDKYDTKIEKQCGDMFLLRFNADIFNYTGYLPVTVKKTNDFVKLLSYGPHEITLFKDGRMNVYGVENEEAAEKIYREIVKSIS
ncbi:thiamine/molybdopterin biosynthesis protein [Staphylococcus xylosus]|nr:thiamine/molybdopterin biosynthesis protein [Staphylococcus xylosus]